MRKCYKQYSEPTLGDSYMRVQDPGAKQLTGFSDCSDPKKYQKILLPKLNCT